MGKVPSFYKSGIPKHQQSREGEWRKFINSKAWRRCAKSYLVRNPACVECMKHNILTPSNQVHHTRGPDQQHAFDDSTFMALCASCHSRITMLGMKQAKE